jgi:predicted metal-dependent peptidase
MIQRNLLDPHKLAEDNLTKLNEKLSSAKAILALNPQKGGMPFIYSFASTREHHLDEIRIGKDANGKDISMETAATDGKVYKWHPKFLEKLTIQEVKIVIAHETYHIVMQHCNANRAFGKNPAIWNIAIDYVVNSAIEHDMRLNLANSPNSNHRIDPVVCDRAYSQGTEHPIWKGNLGSPLKLKDFIKDLVDAAKSLKKNGSPSKPDQKKDEKTLIFADFSLYGRSAESIYDEIMNKMRENGGGDLDDILQQLGYDPSSLDAHEKIEISRTKLLEDTMNAASAAKKLAGILPSAIEDELKNLMEPKLKWQDIVRHAVQTISQEKGMYNDWKRFRRRSLSLGFYVPKKKDTRVRWLCLLDTSGSMSNDDIAYGISQLKILDGRSSGIIVPCDAKPYWEAATEVHRMTDLPKIKIVGRGGTVFNDFFRDYRKYIKQEIDLIIVITDGFIGGALDVRSKPPVDTVFVITNEHMPKLPFGRVAPLRGI